MPDDKTYSSEDAFKKWQGYLIENHDARYKRGERKVHLAHLTEIMSLCGVSYEDALMFRHRAMQSITTEEGRKGKGKHKGWKEACLEDFDALMANQYVDINGLDVDNNGKLNVNIQPFTPDPDIEAWVKARYGGDQTILEQAHIVGNMYNLYYLDYQNEVENVTT